MKHFLSILLVLILALGALTLACAEGEETFDDPVITVYRLEGEPERYLLNYYEDAGWERYFYWDVVDADGNVLAAHFADEVYPSPDGWYAVEIDETWHVMDASGEIAGEPLFEDFEPFQLNGLAAVKQEGLWGIIRADGSWLVKPQYDEDINWWGDALNFDNGVTVVFMDGKYGYLKEDGTYLFEPQFDNAYRFYDTIAVVQKGNLYGYVTIDGEMLFEPQFDDAASFSENYAVVELDGLKGYVNRLGEITIQPRFEEAENFRGDYALVKQDGLYGYINSSGEYVIAPRFLDASGYICDGLAQVSEDGEKWGYIAMNGEYLFEPRFDKTSPFWNGLALIVEISQDPALAQSKWPASEWFFGLVDAQGNMLLEPIYEDIHFYIDGNQLDGTFVRWMDKELSNDFTVIAVKDGETSNFVFVDGVFQEIPVVYQYDPFIGFSDVRRPNGGVPTLPLGYYFVKLYKKQRNDGIISLR